MAKYPKLTHKEINDEVVKRTGQSSQLVGAVIRAYRDVMREAITNGVEVVIPEMCTLTFRDHPPRPAGEYWDGLTKTRHYFPNRQGYYALNIKPHEKVKQGIKRNTLYGDVATKEEWLEFVKTYRPDQQVRDWLLKEDIDDGEQDE